MSSAPYGPIFKLVLLSGENLQAKHFDGCIDFSAHNLCPVLKHACIFQCAQRSKNHVIVQYSYMYGICVFCRASVQAVLSILIQML